MLVGVVIAAVLLLALKGKPSGAQQQQKPKQTPDAGSGAGPNVGQIAGGAAAVATTAVGLLKGAGLFGGTGTAATTATTGTVTTATAATTDAAADTGAEVGADVAAGSLGAAFAQVGIAYGVGIIISIILYAFESWGLARGKWDSMQRTPVKERYLAYLCANELATVNAIVDPNHGDAAPPRFDQATGALLPDTSTLVTQRAFLGQLDVSSVWVDASVPLSTKLPAIGILQLWRIARWAAVVRLEAMNAAVFSFWNSDGLGGAVAQNMAMDPGDCTAWLREVCAQEPYGDGQLNDTGDTLLGGIRFHCAADYDELARVARRELGADYPTALAVFTCLGRCDALAFAGSVGYSFGWPGDEEYTREVVRRSGVSFNVAPYSLGGTFRWVAVDPTTATGIDIVLAHETQRQVLYTAAQLGMEPPLIAAAPALRPLAATVLKSTTAPLARQPILVSRHL